MIIFLSGFKNMEFPSNTNIVYIIYLRQKDKDIPFCYPFYVGQSSRHVGRLGDYISRQFTASADFKVGEAIHYVQRQGLYVGVWYKETPNCKEEESDLINKLGRKYKLLNKLPGYDYLKAIEENERSKIQNFMSEVIDEYFALLKRETPWAIQLSPPYYCYTRFL